MRESKIFLTVDTVVIRVTAGKHFILLIKRKNAPFMNAWALPGGFVNENEDLEHAAIRELAEETGLEIQSATQLKAFGSPQRDPRHHTVSVAFLAFAQNDAVISAADDAIDAKWFEIGALPTLAFDHLEIIKFAMTKIPF